MKAPLLLLGLAISLSLMLVFSGAGLRNATDSAAANAAAPSTAAVAPTSDDSAEGQVVLQRCGTCHGLETLSHNPQTAAGWSDTVDAMVKLGAQVSAADQPALVDYLAKHFGRQ